MFLLHALLKFIKWFNYRWEQQHHLIFIAVVWRQVLRYQVQGKRLF